MVDNKIEEKKDCLFWAIFYLVLTVINTFQIIYVILVQDYIADTQLINSPIYWISGFGVLISQFVTCILLMHAMAYSLRYLELRVTI